MTSDAITWIHLSDFHAGQGGDTLWNQIDQELKVDVIEMAERLGPPDLVLFTGDLANWGLEEEYRRVDQLLERMGGWLGRELLVFAVPGNHDLVRPKDDWTYAALRGYEGNASFQRALWESDARPLDPLFTHYTSWVRRRVVEPMRAAEHEIHVSDRVPGDLSVIFRKGSMKLGLIGLNTAWAHLWDDVERKLLLFGEQLTAALPPSNAGNPYDWFDRPDASLLLTHHPRSWLSTRALEHYEEQIHPPGRFALALFGHVHQPKGEVIAVSGTSPRAFFQATSLLGLKDYGTRKGSRAVGYAWGRRTPDGELRVWPRKRVPRHGGHWRFDRDQGFEEQTDELGGIVLVEAKRHVPVVAPRPVSTVSTSGELSLEEIATYREAVRVRYGVNYFIGFPNPIEYGVSWEELYVELDMLKAHGHSKQDWFAGPETVHGERPDEVAKEGKTVELDEAFQYAHGCNRRAMVMLGDPGSGKTTQLRQMLLRVLDEDRGPTSLGLPEGTVPVFVAIRDLPLPPKGPRPKLEDLVRSALSEHVDGVSPELARRLLDQPSVLYLLDGLDEIPDAKQRARMTKVISEAQRRLSKQHLMVNSRYAGYADVKSVHLGNAFLELRLQPLDDEQVTRLVHNWHQAIEAMEAKTKGRPTSPEAATERAAALLGRLRGPGFAGEGRLGELARTPLLLTALCLIDHERRSEGGLPNERSEIYRTCEEILLEDWRREVKGRDLFEDCELEVDGSEARRILQCVAYWLHREEERRTASVDELREPVAEGLSAVGHDVTLAETFVRSIANESGLLTPYGPSTHGFIHLGFQEHLAALHVRERWESESEVLADFVSRRGQGWWREVSRMALTDASPAMRGAFVRRVMAGPELSAWSRTRMLAGCLRESAADVVGVLEAVLREPTQADDPKRQLDALRLLVHWVLPHAPEQEPRLDGWLREHPVEAVRRRWLTRARTIELGPSRFVEKAGVELMPIPGGWFSMGSPADDDTAWGDETPQHEVELEAFWLARTPVTNAQYRRFLEDPDRTTTVKQPEYWSDERYNQPDQPVVGVSWEEATAYCEWAGLRLPTEAQWEYACRAGTTTRYWSGDDKEDLARVGWYGGNSGGRLHPVGEKPANPWGLVDMHGNIDEWCADTWVPNYEGVEYEPDGSRVKPVGDADRVIRGGYFGYPAHFARSAYRNYWLPDFRGFNVGFRPAQAHP